MTATRTIITFVAFLSLATTAPAHDTTLTPRRREVITSAKPNEQCTLFVATPDGCQGSSERYSVLVLHDADDRAQLRGRRCCDGTPMVAWYEC